MATSYNTISGIYIHSYEISSFNELKIDISILYFLEDEYKTLSKLPENIDCPLFELSIEKYFDFIKFYKLNENIYDIYMKIVYYLGESEEDELDVDEYFEEYHFFIRDKKKWKDN